MQYAPNISMGWYSNKLESLLIEISKDIKDVAESKEEQEALIKIKEEIEKLMVEMEKIDKQLKKKFN